MPLFLTLRDALLRPSTFSPVAMRFPRPKFAFSEVRHLLEMLRDIPSMAFLATGHKCLQFFEVNHKLRDLGTLASP